jgi:hypothetical protein
MASFLEKRGWLYLDFRYQGIRCQEATKRRDTPENRAEIRRLLRRLDGEIAGGGFDYAKWFPHGQKIALIAPKEVEGPPLSATTSGAGWKTRPRIGAGTAYDMKRVIEGRRSRRRSPPGRTGTDRPAVIR